MLSPEKLSFFFIDFYFELFGGPRVLIGMCCLIIVCFIIASCSGGFKEGCRQLSFLADLSDSFCWSQRLGPICIAPEAGSVAN